MKAKKFLALTLIGALMGSMMTFMLMPFFSNGIKSLGINLNTTVPTQTTISISGQDNNLYKAIVAKADPSVVGVTTTGGTLMSESGLGTGVIVDSRGYILTNSHVVSDGSARSVNVAFNDGTTAEAEILWTDKILDLAVIKVDVPNLQAAELGDSDEVEVGDIVVAIGNPLDLEFQSTATEGIISGLGRTIQVENIDGTVSTMKNLIQTSAAINPGNSGGPLLNSKGQVIGINSAKTGEGEGLGFAIPINEAKPIVEEFIREGSFERAKLGIMVINAAVYQEMNNIDLGMEDGIVIVQVDKESIAEKNGLKVHDILLRIEDSELTDTADLLRYLYKVKTGDTIKIVVWRDGEEQTVDVTF